MKYDKLTPEQQKEFIELFPNTNNPVLCKKYNLTISQVRFAGKQLGLKKISDIKGARKMLLNPEQLEEFKKYYPRLSVKEIADKFNIDKNQVKHLARKYKVFKYQILKDFNKEQFIKDYPLMPNLDLSIKYNIPVYRVKCFQKLYKLKKSTQLNAKKGTKIFQYIDRFKKYFKSEQEKIKFIALYPANTNQTLSKIFNLSNNQITYLGQRLELEKDGKILHKTRKENLIKGRVNRKPKPKAEPKPVIKPEPIKIKTIKVDKVFPKSHYQKQAIAKRIEAEKYEKINKGKVKSISQAIQEEIAKGKIAIRLDAKTIIFKKAA